MKILTKLLIGAGALIAITSFIVYGIDFIHDKNLEISKLKQENKALIDSSYAILADLNKKMDKNEKKLSELEIKLTPKPGSIITPVIPEPVQNDSDSVSVSFTGENYLFSYNGFTNLSKATFHGINTLNFIPKPILLKASIFQDADGNYYHKIESEQKELGISTKFKIDKLSLGIKPVIPKPEPKVRVYGLIGLASNFSGSPKPEGGVRLKFFNFNFDATSARVGLSYQFKIL